LAASYPITINNLPTGITLENPNSSIAMGGTGIFRLMATGATQVAGTYSNLTLTIDGTTSAPFTLTILPAEGGAKTITAGVQNGIMRAGIATDTIFYWAKTTGIANGNYELSGSNFPTGVRVITPLSGNRVIVRNDTLILLLVGNASTVAGTYNNLTVSVDGVTSAPFTLTISPASGKVVQVGSQNGTMKAGSTQSVTFTVSTANINNGTYSATVNNQPTGIAFLFPFNVVINGNKGTMTIASTSTTNAGTYNNLTLTIDGTTSAPFTLTISP
jgi:hypothetical protein